MTTDFRHTATYKDVQERLSKPRAWPITTPDQVIDLENDYRVFHMAGGFVHADIKYKTLENRVRRVLKRRGLDLKRSPRRDAAASDFAMYKVVNASGEIEFADHGATLSAVMLHFKIAPFIG